MPDWTQPLRARLGKLRIDPAREAEIVEELAQHLDQRYEDLLSGGLDHDAAMALLSQELRDAENLAESMQPLRQAHAPTATPVGGPRRSFFADLRQDLGLAVRMLRKQAGLTTAVVATLALGIGANGAIFALVDTVLLRELPFPSSGRLVSIAELTETSPASLVSPANLKDWSERASSFDSIAGFVPDVGAMVLSGPDGAENVPRQWVTAGVFSTLGVTPVVGRTFVAADDSPESRLAVLAEAYWRTRFDADPDIVGQSVRLDGETYTIIGVMPHEAELLGATSIWALMPIQQLPEGVRGAYFLETVARLKPGVSSDTARAEMASIAADLAREYPATNEGRGVAIEPLRDAVLGTDLRRTSLLFLGVVGFVLLICFANIANLLLTRTAARGSELAIRSVLGADRKRLLLQFGTENVVLSALGGFAGLLVAAALLRVAPLVIPEGLLPPGIALEFDARIAVFCAAAAVVVGLLFSMASASQVVQLASSRGTLGSRTVTDRSSRTRELLVVGQIATAIVLLYSAGLLSRTLLELDDVDPGYSEDSVLTMLVDPLGESYPSPELLLQFYGAVEDEIEALPGVASVAWTSALPLSAPGTGFFEADGDPAAAPSPRPTAEVRTVSGTYFRTFEVPLAAGRPFDERDTRDVPPACIVNEALARDHVRDASPLGRTLSLWRTEAADAERFVCTIVGVAANTRSAPDQAEQHAQVYLAFTQRPDDDIYLAVRPTSGRAEALTPSIRAAIGRVDREQLVGMRDVMTLEAIGRDATAQYRFRATLVLAFAALALSLAMVGLFGVLAYTVQRGWRDYGVRLALGAKAGDVVSLITRNAARLIAPGAFIGTALALAAGPLLGAMLFGVQPFDLTTLVVVFSVLALTAAASIAGPALRATRVDPANALRNE